MGNDAAQPISFALHFRTENPRYVPVPATTKKKAVATTKPLPKPQSLELILEKPPRVGGEIRVRGRKGIVDSVASYDLCDGQMRGYVGVRYKWGVPGVENYRLKAPEPKPS